MTVLRHELRLEVTLVSPFATRGLRPAGASIDLPLARRADTHRPMLPGTLMRGVLRGALCRLAQAATGPTDLGLGGPARALTADIEALFGRESAPGDPAPDTPWRGQLEVDDLVAVEEPARVGTYPRIRIDEAMGAVDEGFLKMVELAYPVGTPVTFAGELRLKPGDVAAPRFRALVEKALALVPAVGAIKSAGFGRVANRSVGAPEPVRCGPAAVPAMDLDVTYRIDDPFLVGGQPASGNLFVGDDVVPGGAIKGALAQALERAGLLDAAMSEFLARLVIGHAVPRHIRSGALKPLRPLSLVRVELPGGGSGVLDLLHAEALPTARFHTSGNDKAGTLIDAFLAPGWDRPERVVTTRTAIHPDSLAADDEKLFSHAAVRHDEHRWDGRIAGPPPDDRPRLATVLGVLEAGLDGLGKTAARLVSEAVAAVPAAPAVAARPPYALTLRTAALLNDAAELRRGRSLDDDYGLYWLKLGYRLRRWFATQRLAGGYQAVRYPPEPGAVAPYLLTEPGSVFLVEPEARARPIADLVRLGLPVAAPFEGRDWRSCPFLPENGFGQVVLDAVDHRAMATMQPLGDQRS